MTISFFVLIFSILVSIPIRIWQYINIIEPSTGFYSSSHFTIWLLGAILVISSICIIVLTLREKNLMETPMNYGTKGLGLAYIVLSGAMTYSSVQKILLFLDNSSRTVRDNIYMIFSILCAVCFVVLAFLFIVGKTQNTITRIMLMVPVFWSITVLWSTFTGYQTILTISEHLFEIIGFILIVLYNLSFAFVVSGFGGASHQKRMMIYGSIGSLFCIMNSVSKIYVTIKAGANVGDILPTYLLYFSFAVFMIVSIGYLCFGTDRSISMNTYDEIYTENTEYYKNLDQEE